jgi:TolA-binding protein
LKDTLLDFLVDLLSLIHFYCAFSVFPNDVSEDVGTCSPLPSSPGSMETSSLQMEEEEHMDKIRDLHINYRTQIQELQERCRQNERTIQEMDQICREEMRESLRLHERIIRLERE